MNRPSEHSGHAHGPPDQGGHPRSARRFALAISANLVFVVVELAYGWWANSIALLADAGHNFSDVIGLAAAWAAVWLGNRPASASYTYGLRRSSVLAALGNAVLLLVACGAIAWEAIGRFTAPPSVPGQTIMIVAAVGVAVNGAAALLLNFGQHDINLRGAFLHMIADAVVSAGVIASGALILWTGWNWLDPAVSLLIVAVIVVGTWGLLQDSLRMSLDAVPRHIDHAAVELFLRSQPGVNAVHDLHIWSLSTTDVALTAHLVMPDGIVGDHFLEGLSTRLASEFSIGHTTLQVEAGACEHACEMHSL